MLFNSRFFAAREAWISCSAPCEVHERLLSPMHVNKQSLYFTLFTIRPIRAAAAFSVIGISEMSVRFIDQHIE